MTTTNVTWKQDADADYTAKVGPYDLVVAPIPGSTQWYWYVLEGERKRDGDRTDTAEAAKTEVTQVVSEYVAMDEAAANG